MTVKQIAKGALLLTLTGLLLRLIVFFLQDLPIQHDRKRRDGLVQLFFRLFFGAHCPFFRFIHGRFQPDGGRKPSEEIPLKLSRRLFCWYF